MECILFNQQAKCGWLERTGVRRRDTHVRSEGAGGGWGTGRTLAWWGGWGGKDELAANALGYRVSKSAGAKPGDGEEARVGGRAVEGCEQKEGTAAGRRRTECMAQNGRHTEGAVEPVPGSMQLGND